MMGCLLKYLLKRVKINSMELDKRMYERRRYIRFNTNIGVSTYSQEQKILGSIENISMGGARLFLPTRQFSCGEDIDIYLHLPNLPPLKIVSQVIWVKERSEGSNLGIKFVIFPDRYKQDIYEFIFNYYREEILSRWWEGDSNNG